MFSRHQELSPEEWNQVADVVTRGLEFDVGRPTIVGQLINLGFDGETAVRFVDEFEALFLSDARRWALRQQAKKDLVWGVVILLVGVVITLGTFAAAGAGAIFIATTGAFLVGGLKLLLGLYRWVFG